MSQRSTIVTVAREAGVSTSTVSQVLRGSGRISEKTRKKVLKVAERLKYQRDHHAVAMRSKQFKEIGLLINQMANPFNAAVVAGVSDRLESEGYLVFPLDMRNDERRQRRYLDTLLSGARGGLLWVPTANTDKDMIELVLSRAIPTVTFLRRLSGGNFDHVGIENTAGTREATEYLLGLGHRHIGFLGGEGEIDVRMQRIAGYREAMTRHGLDNHLIWPCAETKESAVKAMPELLERHPQITAIVCSGDIVAMGATLGLSRMGLVAGKDISIVGFDGTEEAELWTPPLTTLTVNAFGLGELLAQVLLDRIEKPNSLIRSINVSARLDIRQSTGPLTRDGQSKV